MTDINYRIGPSFGSALLIVVAIGALAAGVAYTYRRFTPTADANPAPPITNQASMTPPATTAQAPADKPQTAPAPAPAAQEQKTQPQQPSVSNTAAAEQVADLLKRVQEATEAHDAILHGAN